MTQRKRQLVREIVGGEPCEYYPLGEYIVAAPGVSAGQVTYYQARDSQTYVLPLP